MIDRNRLQFGLFANDEHLGTVSRVIAGDGDLSADKHIWVGEVIGTRDIGILKTPGKSANRDTEESAKNWVEIEIGDRMNTEPKPEWRKLD